MLRQNRGRDVVIPDEKVRIGAGNDDFLNAAFRRWTYAGRLDCQSRDIGSTEVQAVIIGQCLRALHEEKKFSQGTIEKRTGLLRCYISCVENGHKRRHIHHSAIVALSLSLSDALQNSTIGTKGLRSRA